MTRRLIIRPRAYDELQELAAYIAKDSLETSDRFTDAALQTIRELPELPLANPTVNPDDSKLAAYRRINVKGFRNHLIFYRVHDDAVEIVRVLHGARDLPAILRDTE